MATKKEFHTSLIGKVIAESPAYADNNRAKLKYYGLSGNAAEIVGAWIDNDGAVKLLVRDEEGRAAEIYTILFLIKDKEGK